MQEEILIELFSAARGMITSLIMPMAVIAGLTAVIMMYLPGMSSRTIDNCKSILWSSVATCTLSLLLSHLAISIPVFAIIVIAGICCGISKGIEHIEYFINSQDDGDSQEYDEIPSVEPKREPEPAPVREVSQPQQVITIRSPEIRMLLAEISNLRDSIISYAEKELEERQVERICRELDRYMSFAHDLAVAYENLKNVNIDSLNKKNTMDKILEALESCKKTFRSMFDSIVETASMDTIGDIGAMETMMAPYLDKGLQMPQKGVENQK